MKKFEAGDRVLMRGVVGYVNHPFAFTIVNFNGFRMTFTRDGRITTSGNIILEHAITSNNQEAPPIDTLVRVWNNAKGDAVLRYSSGILSYDGKLSCYSHGRTSKTNKGFSVVWNNWEVVNDE